MVGKPLKLGWLLLGIWLFCIALIAMSYRSTSATNEQIHELGNSIQELRETLTYDAPYRSKMVDSQALNLQLIYALRLQLEANYQQNMLLPDIQQFLFTADRFIEQTQNYLNSSFELLSLIEQIRTMRVRYQDNPEISILYLKLSANVLESMFSDSNTAQTLARELDQVYVESSKLSSVDRKGLQVILAEISSVLGGYAQGQYIVDKLISHDVHTQITFQRSAFNDLLIKHVVLAGFVSFITLLAYIWLLKTATVRASFTANNNLFTVHSDESDGKQRSPSNEEEAVTMSDLRPKQDDHQPDIDFDKMLESLNQDKESVCMLLEVFVEDHTGDVERITQLLTDSPEEAERRAHSLKGVGGNLGASKLREAASQVEIAIKTDVTQVAELLDELKVCLDNAVEEARNFLKENS
ncbi:Hpt domain-containing protein [Vibrio aquaticus]|uniref:Hpt domain-containing protein n=1 Tax=Vibrio aquaticus TaxID=2496559 RepID=A0A3S0PM22_9VIBR|nr:Hpt domain-containing protein [Vibrio aquaticus]RTZ14127.1 Hpt domain-containing protein [Vibrio aquaticus]